MVLVQAPPVIDTGIHIFPVTPAVGAEKTGHPDKGAVVFDQGANPAINRDIYLKWRYFLPEPWPKNTLRYPKLHCQWDARKWPKTSAKGPLKSQPTPLIRLYEKAPNNAWSKRRPSGTVKAGGASA